MSRQKENDYYRKSFFSNDRSASSNSSFLYPSLGTPKRRTLSPPEDRLSKRCHLMDSMGVSPSPFTRSASVRLSSFSRPVGFDPVTSWQSNSLFSFSAAPSPAGSRASSISSRGGSVRRASSVRSSFPFCRPSKESAESVQSLRFPTRLLRDRDETESVVRALKILESKKRPFDECSVSDVASTYKDDLRSSDGSPDDPVLKRRRLTTESTLDDRSSISSVTGPSKNMLSSNLRDTEVFKLTSIKDIASPHSNNVNALRKQSLRRSVLASEANNVVNHNSSNRQDESNDIYMRLNQSPALTTPAASDSVRVKDSKSSVRRRISYMTPKQIEAQVAPRSRSAAVELMRHDSIERASSKQVAETSQVGLIAKSPPVNTRTSITQTEIVDLVTSKAPPVSQSDELKARSKPLSVSQFIANLDQKRKPPTVSADGFATPSPVDDRSIFKRHTNSVLESRFNRIRRLLVSFADDAAQPSNFTGGLGTTPSSVPTHSGALSIPAGLNFPSLPTGTSTPASTVVTSTVTCEAPIPFGSFSSSGGSAPVPPSTRTPNGIASSISSDLDATTSTIAPTTISSSASLPTTFVTSVFGKPTAANTPFQLSTISLAKTTASSEAPKTVSAGFAFTASSASKPLAPVCTTSSNAFSGVTCNTTSAGGSFFGFNGTGKDSTTLTPAQKQTQGTFPLSGVSTQPPATTSAQNTSTAPSVFGFGKTSVISFPPAGNSGPTTSIPPALAPAKNPTPFTFGGAPVAATTAQTATGTTGFAFGSQTSAPSTNMIFGATSTGATQPFGSSANALPAPIVAVTTAQTATGTTGFAFGSQSSAPSANIIFGATSTGATQPFGSSSTALPAPTVPSTQAFKNPSSFAFGAAPATTTTQSTGGFVFGSQATATAPSTSTIFGAASTGQKPFGSSTAVAASTLGFGGNHVSSNAGITPASSGFVFGAKPSTASLFGATANTNTDSKPVFGITSTTSASTGGFGGLTNGGKSATVNSGFAFGATQPAAGASNSLFGSAAAAPQSTASNSFFNSATPSVNMFSNASAAKPTGSALFGSPAGSVFGGATATTAASSTFGGGVFGSSSSSSQNLFGATKPASKPAMAASNTFGGFNFSNKPATTASVFPVAAASTTANASNSFGKPTASIFGQASNQTSDSKGGFGFMSTTQQPSQTNSFMSTTQQPSQTNSTGAPFAFESKPPSQQSAMSTNNSFSFGGASSAATSFGASNAPKPSGGFTFQVKQQASAPVFGQTTASPFGTVQPATQNPAPLPFGASAPGPAAAATNSNLFSVQTPRRRTAVTRRGKR